jgi:molecular chaperone HscA
MNIGIDLGTTNSLVAVVMDKSPRCLLDDDGEALLPSAVRIDGDAAIVGRAAFEPAPGELFTSVKRFMGRAPREVRDEAQLFHYDLVDDPKVVRFRAGDRGRHARRDLARILEALKARAVECLFSAPQGRGDHGAGLLRRRAAPGDEGRGPRRGARSAPAPQRADRCGARLRDSRSR